MRDVRIEDWTPTGQRRNDRWGRLATGITWALLVTLIAPTAARAQAAEPRPMAGGGVVFASLSDGESRLVLTEPARLRFDGTGTQTEIGPAQVTIELDGVFAEDASGSRGFLATGELRLAGAGGVGLRLYLDLSIRTEEGDGQPIPPPYPLQGRFGIGGGSAPYDAAVGYGRITGALVADGTMIYRLDGEVVGPTGPPRERREPAASSGESPRGRDRRAADLVWVHGLRFVDPGLEEGPLRDLLSQPFDSARRRLLEHAGRTLTLAVPPPGQAPFEPIEIPGVMPVWVDGDRRSFTVYTRGGTGEAPVDVLFAGVWGDAEAGKLTLAARRPSLRLGDWNDDLESSVVGGADLRYATVLLSGSAQRLDTSRLPGPAPDFFDGRVLTLRPGFNVDHRGRLHELGRLRGLLGALGIGDAEVTLRGALELAPGSPFALGSPPAFAESLSLEAQLPPGGRPTSLAGWPAGARARLSSARVVDRRLAIEHAARRTGAWIVERVEVEIGDRVATLTVATQLGKAGAGATRVRLPGALGVGAPWRTPRQAAELLDLAAPVKPPRPRLPSPSKTTRLGPYPHLSLDGLTELLQSQLGGSLVIQSLGDGLPPGALELRDVEIEIADGAGSAESAFAVTASASILDGVTTDLLISSVDLGGPSVDVLIALRPPELTFGQLFPGAPAADLRLPAAVLTVLKSLGPAEAATISAGSLSGLARAFYAPVLGAGDFDLELEEGVHLVATYPLDQLPDLVLQTLGISSADRVVVEGSVRTDLGALATGDLSGVRGMYVKALLPTPSTPPAGFPAAFRHARVTDLTLELAYVRPEVVARVGAAFEAVLDGESRSFVGSTTVSLGAAPTSITLIAAMEGPWQRPFGLAWLDLERVGAFLRLGSDGSRAELFGVLELGGRTVSVDLDLAGSGTAGSVELTARVDQLTPDALAELLRQHTGFDPRGGGLPGGISELHDVTLRFAADGGTSLNVSADAVYEAELDGAVRRFVGPADVRLHDGELTVSLEARLEGSWDQPFGVSWLALDDVALRLEAGEGHGAVTYDSYFMVGGRQVDLDIELAAGAGGPSARLVGRVDHLSLQDFTRLVRMHLPAAAAFEGSGLNLSFQDVTMTLEVGARRSFSIAATTDLNGRSADLLLSATAAGEETRIVTGLQIEGWSLADALPALRGTLVEQLRLDAAALLLAEGSVTLDSGDLSPEAYAFFRRVQATDDFRLKLSPGVSLLGVLPIGDTSPLRLPLAALGSAAPAVVVAGSLPGSVLGLGSGGGVSLRAALPPMSPVLPDGSRPPWFRSGQLGVFLRGGEGGVAAGVDGMLEVVVDGTDMEFVVAGELGGTPPAVTLSGRLSTEEAWVQPFGIGFLTVRQLGVALSVNPATASLGLGFHGDADIAAKSFEVDIALALNVSTGVPTNFVFRGASPSSFALGDLILLQQQAAAASGAPAVPTGLVPDLEIRPVDADRPIEVKFALRDTDDVSQGLALRGALFAALAPGAALQMVAVVDAEISAGGLFLFGRSPQAVGVGQLSLEGPTVQVALVPFPPAGSFVLRGEIALPWFTRTIAVELDGATEVDEAIDTLTSILAAWDRLVSEYRRDPVAAMRSSLAGLFDVAGVPAPPWVEPLFGTIEAMQELFPGSDGAALLGDALAGVEVTIPAGAGFPEGGREPLGCALGQTLHQGRCWTVVPFPGEELGNAHICLSGVEEAGQCWLVPPSATRTVARQSYCCQRNRRLQCTKTCTRCPALTTESGGRCYAVPPGLPALSSPSTPQPVCLGQEVEGTCWKMGRAPRAGVPTSGDDLACPVVAPIYAGDRCWVIPPTPSVQVERLPGVCAELAIHCSVDALLTETISPLISNAVEALIAALSSARSTDAAPSVKTAPAGMMSPGTRRPGPGVRQAGPQAHPPRAANRAVPFPTSNRRSAP